MALYLQQVLEIERAEWWLGDPVTKRSRRRLGSGKQADIRDTREAECVRGNNGSGTEQSGFSPEGMVAAMPRKETWKAILTNPVRQASKIDQVSNSSSVASGREGARGYGLLFFNL